MKKVRFYRSNLATIVWDPKNNRPLCEFVDAQVITDEERVINKLRELGYPEVDMDAVVPPPIPEVVQIGESPDVPILSPGVTEETALKRAKLEAARLEAKKESVIPTPKKEAVSDKPEKAKVSDKKVAKPKVTSKKRMIRRRSE